MGFIPLKWFGWSIALFLSLAWIGDQLDVQTPKPAVSPGQFQIRPELR